MKKSRQSPVASRWIVVRTREGILRSRDDLREPFAAGISRAYVGRRRPRSLSMITSLIALCAISACGFQPIYGTAQRATMNHELESVQIETDATRPGQLLKSEIEDQVNPAARTSAKPFRLKITVKEIEVAVFVAPDGTAGRSDIQYISHYTLTRLSDNKVIDAGDVTQIVSYNISTTADYATFVARADARKRGMIELAQDYKLRLINLLSKINDANAPEVKPVKPVEVPMIHPLPGQTL